MRYEYEPLGTCAAETDGTQLKDGVIQILPG